MRKLSLLFLLVLFASCRCVIGQIPPQVLYVDDNCQAMLPDYRINVTVSDNCGVKSIIQLPEPGYMMDYETPEINVIIRATDVFNNITEVNFMVTAVDTVPPVILWDTLAFIGSWQQIDKLYNVADKMIAEQERYFDERFNWGEVPEEMRPDMQYWRKNMVIYSPPAYAYTKEGSRTVVFLSDEELNNRFNETLR